jgi:hypothetical protein
MRRFANFPCPVRTHHVSFVLNDLECSQLREMTSFAGYCAPAVHQNLAPSRELNIRDIPSAGQISPPTTRQPFGQRVCFGRGPTDSNSSIPYFGFSVFSVIWGICFSLKANPNGMETSDSGTVLAQGTRLLCKARGEPLVRQFYWHTGTTNCHTRCSVKSCRAGARPRFSRFVRRVIHTSALLPGAPSSVKIRCQARRSLPTSRLHVTDNRDSFRAS